MVCLPVIHTYLWALSKQKTTAEERYIRSPLSRSVHQTERRKYLFVEGICSMIFAPDWVCELVQCIVHSVENLGCLKRSRESVVWRPLSEIFQSTSCLHFSYLSRSSVGFTKRSMKMNGLTCFKAAGKCEVFILAVSLKESILLRNAAAWWLEVSHNNSPLHFFQMSSPSLSGNPSRCLPFFTSSSVFETEKKNTQCHGAVRPVAASVNTLNGNRTDPLCGPAAHESTFKPPLICRLN